MARYRAADTFLQVLTQIYPKDLHIKEFRKGTQAIVKLDIELCRLGNDMEIFPYVEVKVLDLFYDRYSNHECYTEFLKNYPYDMMDEMEYMKEEIAYGVLRIKKKYPSLYKEFNEELVDLFNQATVGMNREQRRRLK